MGKTKKERRTEALSIILGLLFLLSGAFAHMHYGISEVPGGFVSTILLMIGMLGIGIFIEKL